MVKKVYTRKWRADTELEVKNIAFAVPVMETKKRIGRRSVQSVDPDWLREGQIYWDPGKRLRGWIKECFRTVYPSKINQVQYGVKCLTLPEPGEMIIGTKKDLVGDPKFPESEKEYLVTNGLPYPFIEFIKTKDGSSIRAYRYLMSHPITVNVAIYGFARGLNPDIIEELMREIGGINGLGDCHNSGPYGLFEVKKFDVVENKKLPI